MTREEFRLKGVMLALATLILPFIGLAAFFIKPLAALAPVLFYGGPVVLLILFLTVKFKEKKISWKMYKCPYCGEFFEAEPKEGKVKHLLCRHEVYIENDE